MRINYLIKMVNSKVIQLINTKKEKVAVILSFFLLIACESRDTKRAEDDDRIITELNQDEIQQRQGTIALLGATLIDGTGAEAIRKSAVIIEDNIISAVGRQEETEIPEGAEIVNLDGLTLLPGLIDAHYHNGYSQVMPPLFLSKGITSVRDPGAWMDFYDSVRMSGKKIPRLFLTGPHIDMYPPAYPGNSYLVKDPEEARLAVALFASQGATAIKVYFRLPVAIIRSICEEAHERGIPVTAHLEITNARDAINAGLDGIEHITSFGTCLLPPREVEKYKQAVLADNDARKRGRYEAWNSIEMSDNPEVDSLIQFLTKKKTFVTPTLAIFEKQSHDSDSVEVNGFANMLRFVELAHKAGAEIVVGSHTWVPYAEIGFAYFREMELLQDAGLNTMEIIQAATLSNARFLRISERLGSIEPGKLADLLVIEGDPLKNIRAMRNVRRVMLNGAWVE
jgi:imidazolonepropionase-like amidohydrolase